LNRVTEGEIGDKDEEILRKRRRRKLNNPS
jgi:hypothetical protein